MTISLIETVTVGSGGASSIDFMSVGDIPSDYTDLVLRYALRNSDAQNYLTLSFNGSTANFTQRQLDGDGSSTGSATRTDSLLRLTVNPSNFTGSVFSNTEIYIPNYRSALNKAFTVDGVTENNNATSYIVLMAAYWSITDPITSISLAAPTSFVEFSTASLYGVTAGSDGIASVS